MFSACRWLNETHVIPYYNVPYNILEKLNAHFTMHGDDIINDEYGNNIYSEFINNGKFKSSYKGIQENAWHFNNRHY